MPWVAGHIPGVDGVSKALSVNIGSYGTGKPGACKQIPQPSRLPSAGAFSEWSIRPRWRKATVVLAAGSGSVEFSAAFASRSSTSFPISLLYGAWSC
jgi:hypothetical protein